MIRSSTIQLLRFHFSFFLMPVFFFALSVSSYFNWPSILMLFVILHGLVYPASNGYNSYMDRDTDSIGGLEKPMLPTKQLYTVTWIMDVAAVLLGFLIHPIASAGIFLYILASRAYSYRGIRLKKFPVTGYITVVLFQGVLVFLLTYYSAAAFRQTPFPVLPAIAAGLLIGGFYPLTQIYQHNSDKADGVLTISAMLGYRGTFIFSAIMYTLAIGVLSVYYFNMGRLNHFFLLTTLLLPVLVYFIRWALLVWHDILAASFINTMKMNVIAATCTSIAFITLLIWKFLE